MKNSLKKLKFITERNKNYKTQAHKFIDQTLTDKNVEENVSS